MKKDVSVGEAVDIIGQTEKVIKELGWLRDRLQFQKDITGYGYYIEFLDEAIKLLNWFCADGRK